MDHSEGGSSDTEDAVRHRVIRLSEVVKITSLSRSTIYLYMSRGDFPRPLRIGRRTVGWRYSHVHDWIESRPTTKPNFEA